MSQSNIAEQVIPRVLTAAHLGGLKLKNRLAVAPMTRVTATEHGKITAAMHEYYLRFAQGGFGLVITEGLYTDKHYSQGYAFQPGLADDEQAQAWAATVQAVQAGGSRFFAQPKQSFLHRNRRTFGDQAKGSATEFLLRQGRLRRAYRIERAANC